MIYWSISFDQRQWTRPRTRVQKQTKIEASIDNQCPQLFLLCASFSGRRFYYQVGNAGKVFPAWTGPTGSFKTRSQESVWFTLLWTFPVTPWPAGSGTDGANAAHVQWDISFNQTDFFYYSHSFGPWTSAPLGGGQMAAGWRMGDKQLRPYQFVWIPLVRALRGVLGPLGRFRRDTY